MRFIHVLTVAVLIGLAGCSQQTTDEPQGAADATPGTKSTTDSRTSEEQAPDGTEMIEQSAGEGASIGCNSRDDCDIEFTVNSVASIDCAPPGGGPDQGQVVRVDIEVEVRDQVTYPDALNIFNLGSWSAVTDDGYTLRSLDIASGCDNQDLSLLTYGINAGEKVRNRIDFTLPANVHKIQLQPAALDGGGWSWPVQ